MKLHENKEKVPEKALKRRYSIGVGETHVTLASIFPRAQ